MAQNVEKNPWKRKGSWTHTNKLFGKTDTGLKKYMLVVQPDKGALPAYRPETAGVGQQNNRNWKLHQ